VFTAANLQRIPPFSPDATDYCTLAFSVSQLQTQMAQIQQCLSTRPVGIMAQPQVTTEAVSVADKINMLMAPVDESSLATTSQDGTRGNGSWAQTAAENPELVSRMRPGQVQRSKVQIKVKGTKVSDNGGDKIKAVPRTAVLTAFVGRLGIDTTEEDLTRYLTDEGMKGIVCRKLKAKDGRTFNTAAFRVTCSEDSRDLFYNDNCWPAGAELRDWIFYN